MSAKNKQTQFDLSNPVQFFAMLLLFHLALIGMAAALLGAILSLPFMAVFMLARQIAIIVYTKTFPNRGIKNERKS